MENTLTTQKRIIIKIINIIIIILIIIISGGSMGSIHREMQIQIAVFLIAPFMLLVFALLWLSFDWVGFIKHQYEISFKERQTLKTFTIKQ